jgi:hypothetical protein
MGIDLLVKYAIVAAAACIVGKTVAEAVPAGIAVSKRISREWAEASAKKAAEQKKLAAQASNVPPAEAQAVA